MKFLHLADLHLGKVVLETPMLENQRTVLKAAVDAAVNHHVDAVVMAGDIYDRSVPPAEAVCVLDDFISDLNKHSIAVLAVSGNHDSPERLEFGSRLFSDRCVHIAGYYSGTLRKVTFQDDYGQVHFHLLPFIKPAMVRSAFGEEISGTEEAVRAALRDFYENESPGRHVLIAHQFVCFGGQTPETCDSEAISVGGSDSVDISCFDGFDYVALGHLHRAQRMGRDTVRYAGSPLKYSLSEVRHSKSFTLVTLLEKGQIDIELLPITPLHDMRRIKGRLDDLITAARENPSDSHDYIHAVLTEENVLDPAERLRQVYPNLIHVEIEQPEREFNSDTAFDPMVHKTESELFEDFYRNIHGRDLTHEQWEVIDKVMERVKGEDAE
ncbi:MAG TPA: exonuclease sbcCD subunit D [Ruminococcaceae bacterium]|nr:exonuclease sbcCD subunit D [Oscillospiraceae bacterium]